MMNFLLILVGMIAVVISLVLFGFLIYWVQKTKKWIYLGVVAVVIFLVFGIWWLNTTGKIRGKESPAEARVVLPIYGTYDFSSATAPGEVKVPFRPDAVTEVTLPPAVVFRTDPSSDIEIVFIDGSRYIDGPARQVWYGLKRGVFKIRGLTETGVLKITLEKKI